MRVVIVGGGYVGMYSALTLERELRPGEAEVTLISPESYMTYQSFLPEAASGSIEPRHVVVPLRQVLRRTRLIIGGVISIDHAHRTATIRPSAGTPYEIGYDHVVIGPGSVSRVLPIPGLAEHGVGFKSVGEAIHLRNQVLSCMDAAESTDDDDVRRHALTFLFVGGGYAGVEALAELEDLARDACRTYRAVTRADMRWVLVEATDSILPEIGRGLGDYAIDRLRHRGIEVRLNTRLESAENGIMRLSDGEEIAADTLVWTTGVRAHPLVATLGFPVDDAGRLVADEYLRVRGLEGAWTAGDCAAVPDLTTGGLSPPTAQHALRQAKRLGKNVALVVRGREPVTFRYRNLGTLVSLGRYKGVARVLGIRIRGPLAWFLHRTYHLTRIPTFNRKVRILVDWNVALFFKRDIVQLGALERPRAAFSQAADAHKDRPTRTLPADRS